jgi:Ca2+-binding RTX toxin-like protein
VSSCLGAPPSAPSLVGAPDDVGTAALCLAATATPASAQKCNGDEATISGTAGDDRLRGTPGTDVIEGRTGDDRISGLDGIDLICGYRFLGAALAYQ